jgi:arginine N-succinyltransferase
MDDSSIVIRQVQVTDLDFLYTVAKKAGVGFTSFPDDAAYLEKKLHRSLDSFAGSIEKKSGLYLFVLEELATKQNLGICGIEVIAGAGQPFYSYKLDAEHKTISLVNDFTQASEIGSLFLDANDRGHKHGELLSRSRFLFIAEHLDWFYDTIISEIRGVIEGNISPFWEEVGKNFFAMDYTQAEFLKPKNNAFIAELVPKGPIHLDSLSERACNVIGQANINSQAAKHVLAAEGFTFNGYLDVFNAGPVMQATKGQIKTIQNSKSVILSECVNITDGPNVMLCSTKNSFRLVKTKIKLIGLDKIAISNQAAENLRVVIGDNLRYG